MTAGQSGDRGALGEIYESCYEKIYRITARIVGIQDANDVVQQVFLKAFRSIGLFERRSSFATWLYRMAINESLQLVRRNKRRKVQPLSWEPSSAAPGQSSASLSDMLEQALGRLDEELRTIFLLREVEQLSYRDIAEALQVPEGTVGSRLNRARHELKQHLVTLGYNPPK